MEPGLKETFFTKSEKHRKYILNTVRYPVSPLRNTFPEAHGNDTL